MCLLLRTAICEKKSHSVIPQNTGPQNVHFLYDKACTHFALFGSTLVNVLYFFAATLVVSRLKYQGGVLDARIRERTYTHVR